MESPLAAVLVQALVHFHPLGLEVRVAPVPPREFLGFLKEILCIPANKRDIIIRG